MASKTKKKTTKKPKPHKVKSSTKKKVKTAKKKTSKKAAKQAVKKAKKKSTAQKSAPKAKAKKSTAKKAKASPKPPAKAKKKAPPVKVPAKKSKTSPSKDRKMLVVQKHDPSKLDPMVSKIRDQLIRERNELLNMIRSSQEVERNVGDLTFSNEIDLASSLEGREMAFQLSSRERNELKLIEEALFKIKTGTYGVCEGCSRSIGVKRLQIMPLTPLCIECQENLEIG